MRRRVSNPTPDTFALAYVEPYDGKLNYGEVAEIFHRIVDDWYSKSALNEKGFSLFSHSKIGGMKVVIEEISSKHNKSISIKGNGLILQLGLFADKYMYRKRTVSIKYRNVEEGIDIDTVKNFSLGTRRKTINLFIDKTVFTMHDKKT